MIAKADPPGGEIESSLLADYLAQRERDFAFGSFDCALFGADWVKRVHGHRLRREATRL
jgi:hypothetical protein